MEEASRGFANISRRDAIGMIVPFDMELDRELWRWVPEVVDVLVTRTPFLDDRVTIDFARDLTGGGAVTTGVRSVTAGRARVVAYGCTSASFVSGVAGEAQLRAEMLAAGAGAAVTTSGALVDALRHLEVSRVAVATPYLPDLSLLLDGFLRESGIEPVAHLALGLSAEIWSVPYSQTAELIRRVDRPKADAIVVSCTNLPTYDLIAPLERELGKPILSANQVTMWAALRAAGHIPVGPKQALLERE